MKFRKKRSENVSQMEVQDLSELSNYLTKKCLMPKIIFILILISVPFSGFTQTKFEKETCMKKKDVPTKALVYVDSLNFNKKVRWYKETGINRTSIEAKTKYKGKKYSIEFSPDGNLEDIEIKIKWAEIPQNTQTKITEFLNSRYKKYKIDKIQIQYVGNSKTIFHHLRKGDTLEDAKINYEFVINSKVNRTYKKFEYLFSEYGEFLSYAEIVLKNTNNIEY